jgi:adenylate cyclase
MVVFNFLSVIFHWTDLILWLSLNATFVCMGAIGALLAHQLQTSSRRDFIQRRAIQKAVVEIERERQVSEALLLNILPEPIAKRLKRDGGAIADSYAQATILFADLVDFTRLSEGIDAQELVAGLNRIFSSFDGFVDRYDLEKIKTIGDAYMVAGGLHGRPAQEQARAVARLACDMLDALQVESIGGHPVTARIGIHTGPVVAGVIGRHRFIFDVWGDTVNTASRLESHGVPSTIQVSAATMALLDGEYDFKPRGEVELKGHGPMETWFLAARTRSNPPLG